jgi:two-component system, LytTR family, sensor kinase
MKLLGKQGSKWRDIILIAIIVLLFRIFYVDLLNYLQVEFQFDVFDLILQIFKQIPVFLFMLAAGFISIYFINKYFFWGERTIWGIVLLIISFLVITILVTLMLCLPKLRTFSWDDLVASRQLEAVFVVAAMLNILVMGISDVVLYYRKSHKKALDAEIIKKNKANFQYEQLKQQMNPHFLFNSLNVLDYLVHKDTDRASDFIRKLAGVYRYLLSKETETVVTLVEERTFVNMYVDLLIERFSEGLQVEMDLEGQSLKSYVVPCSIQLLVENATKHNVISPETPLHIRIDLKNDFVRVVNNLQPKKLKDDSSKVGLRYIEGQYLAIFGKAITVRKTANNFEVWLPLIQKTALHR